MIIERKDANRDFYHRNISASDILSGNVQRPAAASDLYRALDARAGTHSGLGSVDNIRVASSSAPPQYKPPVPQREPIAVALFDYVAQRPDDLSFKKGDVIHITKQTESAQDWWVGRTNGRTGNFPANYVQLQ